MNDQQRAAFEAWLGFSPMKMDDGNYADPDVCEDWRVWQAALASPEVQALREALRWTAGALQASCVAGKITEADTARALIGNETKSIGQILDAADAALAQEES